MGGGDKKEANIFRIILIKSCNDFMKRGFTAQFGERLKFLSPQPRRRDFRFASTRFWGISEFLPQPTGMWYRTFALKRILYFI
jgi:hypothetical protein